MSSISRSNRPSKGTPKQYTQPANTKENMLEGVFLGRVINNKDIQFNGRFNVELLDGLNPPNNLVEPKDMKAIKTIISTSPFGGSTDNATATDNSKYETSQVSYGMSPQAPPIGATVIVAFIRQQPEGFYLGSIFDKDRNYSLPGLAHAKVNERGDRAPASELNSNNKDFDKKIRAAHPMTANLAESGLAGDYIRGLSSSGGRRDQDNRVFGFLTKAGHHLVMDDGSDNGTDAGIRIRTATGTQILMHDESGIIYISQGNGSAYLEIANDGHIDVYSATSISMHSDENINLHADGSIAMEAANISMKSISGGIKMQSAVGNIELYAKANLNLTADANGNISMADGNLKLTGKRIDFNGAPADKATEIEINSMSRNTSVKQTTTGRVPEHEPWGGRDTFAAQSSPGVETT